MVVSHERSRSAESVIATLESVITMAGMSDHDPGIGDHDGGMSDQGGSESVIRMVRNTHQPLGQRETTPGGTRRKITSFS